MCQASFAAKLVKNEVNWLLKLEKKEDVGKIPRISLHLSFVRIIDIWHLHQFQIFSLLLRISNPQLFKPDRFAFMKTAKFVNKALAVASSTLVNLFTWHINLCFFQKSFYLWNEFSNKRKANIVCFLLNMKINSRFINLQEKNNHKFNKIEFILKIVDKSYLSGYIFCLLWKRFYLEMF